MWVYYNLLITTGKLESKVHNILYIICNQQPYVEKKPHLYDLVRSSTNGDCEVYNLSALNRSVLLHITIATISLLHALIK